MRYNGDGTFSRARAGKIDQAPASVGVVSIRMVDWLLMVISALALFGVIMAATWLMVTKGILSGGTNPSLTGHGPIVDLLCALLVAPVAALASGRFRSELWVNDGGIFWSHRGRQGRLSWRNLSGVSVQERDDMFAGLYPTLHFVFEDGLRRPVCPVDVGGIDRERFNTAFRQKGLLVTDAGDETPGPGVLTIFAVLFSLALFAGGWGIALFLL